MLSTNNPVLKSTCQTYLYEVQGNHVVCLCLRVCSVVFVEPNVSQTSLFRWEDGIE